MDSIKSERILIESRRISGVIYSGWDLGGQEKVRLLWRHYYQQKEGIIFIVDSNDRKRIVEAAEELHRLLAVSASRSSLS